MRRYIFLLLSLLMLNAAEVFGQDAVPVKPKKSNVSALVQEVENRAWAPGKPAKVEPEVPENEKLAKAILEYARKYLGCRYQSGGKGPKRFDCSGFVGYVYRNFGFTMGDSSGDQYLQGIPIQLQECEPGDLIFFNGHAIGSRVGHVGIVVSRNALTGQVQFIHASNSQGVTITKLQSESYYTKRFIGVKRIF